MKKINPYLMVLIVAITIISCKKDEPSGTNNITGNWKFISLSASTQSTVQTVEGGDEYKSITFSDYTSVNNGGTVAITDNSFTGKDITYSIDDTLTYYTYINNELFDSESLPITFTMPPSSSVSNYQMIGQDSIYFTGGNIINSTSGSVEATPTGCRFTMEGNTLKLNCRATKDSIINESGVTANLKEAGVFTMTLEKQ